jgi:ribosomal protein S12 methylthiotransferase
MVTDELLNVIATEDKIVKYMDIPIQHCNETVLKNMRRGGNAQKLRELFKHIREVIPNVTIRTTLITGFPQETEEQFTELAEFVKEIHFDRLGCFPYSQEEGTPAGEMDGQLDEETKSHRAEIIMEQQMLFAEENNEKKLGTVTDVVVEGFDKWAECYFGRTSADAPDIDGKIFFSSDEKLSVGQYVKVQINDVIDYDLCGTVIS